MNKFFLILASLISLQLSALEIDSVQRAKMIREGQAELCNLLEYNAHAAPADKRFLVVIDGDPNGINYTREKQIGTTEDILDQQTVDAINDTIAAAYANYGIEMYVIVMKSFDLLFETELPAYPTARDIFTTRLYDETSNINTLRATHQQLTYEIAFGSMARTKDYLVYSRAEYKSTYAPGKIAAWDLIKTIPIYGTTTTYPKLDELKDCFHARTTNDPNVMQSGLQYSLKAASARFYESAKYMAIKGAIMTTYTTEGMSDIFEQFRPGVDYDGLTEPERRRALSVFAGYSMGDNGIEQEEKYACRIVESTPKEQVPDFLTHLSQLSELNTSPSYQGDKPNKALIVVLIGRMDDVGSGGNNYTRMMRGLTEISMSNESFAAAHMPTTDQQWIDRRVYWDDWHALTQAPIGTHNYDVTLNNDGSVSVEKEVMDKLDEHINAQTGTYYYTEHWDDDYTAVQLNPFDFVIFTNRSSLGMLQVAGAAPDQPFLAPAIFLKYADDKAFNTNAITVTAIVLDIVAITTGPFAILGAWSAGNVALAAYEALQFLGSSLNLIANIAASDEFKEAVGIFNVLVAGWGLAKITVTGAKYTADYLAAVNTGKVQAVPLQVAQQYCTKYDAITNWSHVDDAAKEEMRRMREMLGKQVAAGQVLNFVAISGEELRTHLNTLTKLPARVTYEGHLFKSISKKAEQEFDALPDVISQYSIESAWGRYDTPGESGMYYSATLSGNQTELSHYGEWSSFSTYQYSNAQITDMLDLTSENTRQLLGVDLPSLLKGQSDKSIAYEFTNVIGTWAREKGFKGIIFPGARGSNDYNNIILFEQTDVTFVSSNFPRTQIK